MIYFYILAAYLIGSIPTGVVIARLYGADLRSAGSGNIGATNALRVLGKKAGVLTLVGDMLKGALPVIAAYRFAGHDTALFAAAAAVIGHDFSVFLGFRGGKGVATSFGTLLAVEPLVSLICMVVWAATVIVWRYSSLGALVGFTVLIPLGALLAADKSFIALSVFMTGLIFIKHRSNIGRLLKGEEPRVGRKTAEAR